MLAWADLSGEAAGRSKDFLACNRVFLPFHQNATTDKCEAAVDDLDRRILALIQENFPLVSRPYAVIGEKVSCSEDEAFRRVMAMKKAGVVRRIGANFDSRKLGYVSTLVGMRVPEKDIERVAALVSSYPQVTHNYEREGEVNLWFTLVAESKEKLGRILEEIRTRTPEAELLDLPAKRLFKLRVHFDPSEAGTRHDSLPY